MTKFWQIYYNTIFGAIGGLMAWFLIGIFPTTSWNVHLANMFAGAGIGLLIGAALGVVEGLLVKRSIFRALIGASTGGLAGLVGGAFGLLIGGFVFVIIQGGFIGRMFGWMLLGGALGLGQSLWGLHAKRVVYGSTGGIIGGLVGGALYEGFTQLFIERSGDVQVFLSAAGIILIGMAIGSIVPLTFQIAREGLIVVLTGRRANTEFNILASTSIGSSDGSDVYVPDDKVESSQAVVYKQASGFTIKNTGRKQSFFVNQTLVAPGHQANLGLQARLQMGDTSLKFQARS